MHTYTISSIAGAMEEELPGLMIGKVDAVKETRDGLS